MVYVNSDALSAICSVATSDANAQQLVIKKPEVGLTSGLCIYFVCQTDFVIA